MAHHIPPHPGSGPSWKWHDVAVSAHHIPPPPTSLHHLHPAARSPRSHRRPGHCRLPTALRICPGENEQDGSDFTPGWENVRRMSKCFSGCFSNDSPLSLVMCHEVSPKGDPLVLDANSHHFRRVPVRSPPPNAVQISPPPARLKPPPAKSPANRIELLSGKKWQISEPQDDEVAVLSVFGFTKSHENKVKTRFEDV